MDWRRMSTEVLRLVGGRLEYPDIFDLDQLAKNPDLEIQKAGGGYLVQSRRARRIEEIHVFLHGSIRLPDDLRWAMGLCDLEGAAATIVDNCDLGTSALAMRLAFWMSRDPEPSRAVAFFDVARVLIDANRYSVEDQVPMRPYRGTPILRTDLHAVERQTIIQEWLYPWVQLVAAVITGHGIHRVFHHHTYDAVGQTSSSLDRSPGLPRPAGMIFLESPHGLKGGPTPVPHTLVDLRLLKRILSLLESYLRQIQPDAEVRIDWPYLCPLMPLLPVALPRRIQSPSLLQVATIIYEIRKDLLRREVDLQLVVEAIKAMSKEAQSFQAA